MNSKSGWIKFALLFAIYYLTAKFGLSFDAVSEFATLIWFPSGIATASLLLFGYRQWPAIALGASLVNLFHGAPLLAAIAIGMGNTLEALCATTILKRYKFNNELATLQDVMLLLIAIPISTLISASIGVTSLSLTNGILPSAFYPTLRAWWLGDAISILIITPLILTMRTIPRLELTRKRVGEVIALAGMIVAVGTIVFLDRLHITNQGSPVTYLVFPPLIWAALRFDQKGAILTIFTLSMFAVLGAIQNTGPFTNEGLSNTLFLLELFISVISITTLILAAVVAERKELERHKDAFISIASHELKTPITSLKIFSQVLQKNAQRYSNPQLRKSLNSMNIQIDKLTKLINELLNLSRMQAGKLEYRNDWFDMNILVKEAVTTIKTSNKQYKISIKGKCRSEVFGDKDYIGQVIINLLTNAIKYSDKTNKIIVSLTQQKDVIAVNVQDFGIGIDPKHQQKIFDRFYQIVDTTRKKFFGLGIGLYIASEVIRTHGGRIWVKSTKGKGSTFSFTIPIKSKLND